MKNNLTQTSTITSKYQTVIPRKMREALKIQKSDELIWQIVRPHGRPVILVSPKQKKWSEYLSGLGKSVWKGVNTDTYLKNLKSEWKR